MEIYMYEETLVLLKPDAIERHLVGKIIQRFEENGLEILDINFYSKVSEELIKRHYPKSMAEAIGNKAKKSMSDIADPVSYGLEVLTWLHRYVTRGPIIALKLGGEDAIKTVRRVTGFTDPATAEKGTIRGDFGIDSIRKSTEEKRSCENLVHASGNKIEAEAELALWFKVRICNKLSNYSA
jgi:nucleoside-diphosphate kinase